MDSSLPQLRRREAAGRTVVEVSGVWKLLTDAPARARLRRELTGLPPADAVSWDLRGVQALDSAGAAVLWQSWGRQLPGELICPASQRAQLDRFEAVERSDPETDSGAALWLQRLGQMLGARLNTFTGIVSLLAEVVLSIGYALRYPRFAPLTELSATIYRAGVTSVPLLGILGFLLGVVMAFQVGQAIAAFGANTRIIGIMGLAMTRELGAVIASIILAGRTGSAITAGIGAMHMSGELSALRAFGVSPVLRLALPRTLGLAIATPLLAIWTVFSGIVGAMVVADVVLDIAPQLFLHRLPQDVPLVNAWIGLVKASLYGAVIGLTASYYGLTAASDTASLSGHTTRAVVASLSLVLLLDATSGALLTEVGL